MGGPQANAPAESRPSEGSSALPQQALETVATHVVADAVPTYYQPVPQAYPPPHLGHYTDPYAQTALPPAPYYQHPQYQQAETVSYQTSWPEVHAGYQYPYPSAQQVPYAAYQQPYSHNCYPPVAPTAYPWPPTYPVQATTAPYAQHSGSETYTPGNIVTPGQYYRSHNAGWSQAPYVQTAPVPAQQQPSLQGQPVSPSMWGGTPKAASEEVRDKDNADSSADFHQQAKRRRLHSSATDGVEAEGLKKSGPAVVWVWDLDETLIIFQSLLTGKYADLEGMDEKRKEEGLKLGEKWEKLILDVSDTNMFFERVEECDQPSISHVAGFDDGASIAEFDFEELNLKKPLTDAGKRELAYLYRHIQMLYAKGASSLVTSEKRSEWQALYGATDRFTGGWLTAGRRLLAECSTFPVDAEPSEAGLDGSTEKKEALAPGKRTVVLVSSGQLIPTLTKCLLFRLDPWIHPLNVYSSKTDGKLQCFEWLQEQYSDAQSGTKFVVVGDGIEEQAAARMLKWPFFRVAAGLDPEMKLPNVKVERLVETFL